MVPYTSGCMAFFVILRNNVSLPFLIKYADDIKNSYLSSLCFAEYFL